MEITHIEKERIIPYKNNARINEKTVKALEESIAKFGFLQPICVRQVENGFEIIAGHARFTSMVNRGESTIPCVVIDISEEKAKEYRIADNSISDFSSWDETKLARELEVMENPFDMDNFFKGGVERILGVYATDNTSFSTESVQTTPPVTPTGTVGNGEVVEAQQSVAESTTQKSHEQEVAQKEKNDQYYRDMMNNIENEKMVKNRQYREVICPNCGKKFILSVRN